MSTCKFTVIVAATYENGIGANGSLPWRLPREMARFREVTIGAGNNAVIMGRLTFESIQAKYRPLANRHNIVISSQDIAGVTTVRDFDSALAAASAYDHVYIIGGQRVYAAALAHANCERILLTRVLSEFKCDVFMPAIDADTYTESAHSDLQEESGTIYQYIEYTRTADTGATATKND